MSRADAGKHIDAVKLWLRRFEETADLGMNRPLRSDDRRIVRLFETFRQVIGEKTVVSLYDKYSIDRSESEAAVAIASLKDAYDMQWFSDEYRRRSKEGQDVTDLIADPRYVLAREVWRRGNLRKRIVESIENLLFDCPNASEPKKRSDQEAEKQRGLDLWNSGHTWREVNEQLGRPTAHREIRASGAEIRRYAKDHHLFIRTGRPGRTKKK